MISVVIPTLNAENRLPECLDALVPAALAGLVKEVIIVDGGSADATAEIADSFGAIILTTPPGRGGQLRAGADAARGGWLLFLHADSVLEEDWAEEAARFVNGDDMRAGAFTLAFDAEGIAPKIVAAGAMLRAKLLKSPYGDQGLLISKDHYDAIDGYREMPLFEDVDIIKRIVKKGGHGALCILQSKAVTSAARYEREGYLRRVLKNALLSARYQLGASPEDLARSYR